MVVQVKVDSQVVRAVSHFFEMSSLRPTRSSRLTSSLSSRANETRLWPLLVGSG